MAEKTVAAVENEKTLVKREVQGRETSRNPDYFVSPPVDIYETPESLTVVADLPGVPKDGLDIKVDDNILTIEGKMAHDPQREPTFQEFAALSFFRQFELAETVDQEKISAELTNGVLTLNLPWKEKAKSRQIPIQVS